MQQEAPGPEREQFMITMRHAEREDEVNDSWCPAAACPWDPPLSTKGLLQAQQAGAHLASLNLRFDVLLCSPFLRCVTEGV